MERTGRYYLPVLHASAGVGYEARFVRPSISCYFREADSYDNKTDDTNLEEIYHAVINSFGLQDQALDATYSALQFWSRCRRNLVRKTSFLRSQIHEYLKACLPDIHDVLRIWGRSRFQSQFRSPGRGQCAHSGALRESGAYISIARRAPKIAESS